MQKLIDFLLPVVLAILFGMIMAGPAKAQYITDLGLTKEQQKALLLEAERMRVESANKALAEKMGTTNQVVQVVKDAAGNVTPEKVDAWSQVGANIGKGLVAAAKEIGAEANKFAQTDLGKITVALIVWKIAGKEMADTVANLLRFVTHIFVGVFFPLLWFIGTWYYKNRMLLTKKTYEPFFGPITRVKEVEHAELSGDEKFIMVAAAVIATVIAVISLGTI